MAKAGFVYRQAQARGLLGGSRPWTILWVVLVSRRILRRLLADKPDVVYSETLEPGQTLVITSKDREPRIIGA
jgi:hypothetical protein